MAKKRGAAPTPKRLSAPALQHQDPPGTQYRCTCCGNYYTTQRGNFMTSYSRLFAGWGGYFPVCKTCMAKYAEWLLCEIYDGDEPSTMRRLTQMLDIPYDENALSKAMIQADDTAMGLVNAYYQRMNAAMYKKNGDTYITTVLREIDDEVEKAAAIEKWQEDFREYAMEEAQNACRAEIDALQLEVESLRSALTSVPVMLDEQMDDSDEEKMDESKSEIDEELIHRFGPGFKPEEYDYLQTQYEDWLECYACDTKIQEELFKNICLAQLNIYKAQRSEGGDIAKATKAFNDLVLMANIAPKQQKNLLTEADTFGTLIERWEKEEPIPEPDPVWADVDGIKRYISTWFFGHLCKMFKKENDWAQMYEEELSPYTAHPPEYQGDFDLVEDGDCYEQEADF